MENNKAILLELDVDEGKYIFPNTISDALIDANDERLNLEEQLNETLWKSASDKKKIEDIFTLISKRDVKSYKLAIVELSERTSRINNECKMLREAISKIESFGTDYDAMTEAQQYELGAYLNLMLSSTQLLVNPIMGLLPKFADNEFDMYISWKNRKADTGMCNDYKPLIISFANLLYKIDLDDKDKKLLYKTFKKNKKMLKALDVRKKDFSIEMIDAVEEALSYCYQLKEA